MKSNAALIELRKILLGWDTLREEDGWISTTRLVNALGVDRASVLKRMRHLNELGKVEMQEGRFQEGGKGFFFRILDTELKKKVDSLLTKAPGAAIHDAHGTKPDRPGSRFRTSPRRSVRSNRRR